ncbi:hypothetical protein C1I95_17615 [Micromonospora craterilacus]|uniref:Uncharacterized protein n=1 Tax=Micromonospora craterilacus TaxID=1655439 RepID=A0A2W2ESI8_9ACTN|nr:hypothetical protein [Micromonospora craterilacus]PZG16490.1 hypothetical protein C1I95_17615 [Micromonospora craterilacus]
MTGVAASCATRRGSRIHNADAARVYQAADGTLAASDPQALADALVADALVAAAPERDGYRDDATTVVLTAY